MPLDASLPVARSISLPPPTGGRNTRDPLAAMAPTDAIGLVNIFPDTNECRVREGHVTYSTGMGAGPVEALAEWTGTSANKLIAAANGEIWDASGATAVQIGASGYSSNRWQMDMFNGRLFAGNGVDPPWDYDGTTKTATAWKVADGQPALNINHLVYPFDYRERLYWVELNSGRFWYGGVGAVTDDLKHFDAGQVAHHGGYVVALGAWSAEAGVGIDDRFVIAMSTGEVLVYEGSYPGSSDWRIIGSYYGAEPLGRRCLLNIGGELIFITRGGYMPISVLVRDGTVDALDAHPTWGRDRKIVIDAAKLYGANFGWQALLSPTGEYVIFNIPQAAEIYFQHVLNPVTGAWTIYRGLQGCCWSNFNGGVYFGAMAGTVKRISGATDDGAAIDLDCEQAFTYIGNRARKKKATKLRPIIELQGDMSATLGINVDFQRRSFAQNSINLTASTAGTPWGSPWGSPWSSPPVARQVWFTAPARGRAMSIRFQASTNAQNIALYGWDLLYTEAGSV